MGNKEALIVLERVTKQVAESQGPVELLGFVKIGKDYHRFSTGISDVTRLIGVLELAKADCIQRMSDD